MGLGHDVVRPYVAAFRLIHAAAAVPGPFLAGPLDIILALPLVVLGKQWLIQPIPAHMPCLPMLSWA